MLKKDPTDPFTSSAADGSRAIALTNGQQIDFGSGSFDYLYSDGTFIVTPGSIVASNLYSAVGSGVSLVSRDADDANAQGLVVDTSSAFTTSGGRLGSFRTNAVEKAYIDKDGKITCDTLFFLNGSMSLGYTGSNARLTTSTSGTITLRDAGGTEFATLSSAGARLPPLDGTAGSGTGITVNNTSQLVDYCHKVTVTEAALTAAATTQDITLWTVPAKTFIRRVIAQSTAGFTGGTIADMVIRVGKAANGVEYQADGSVFGTAVLGDVVAEMGAGLKSATLDDFPSFAGAGTVNVRFTATGDNVVNATAGSVTFWIIACTLP